MNNIVKERLRRAIIISPSLVAIPSILFTPGFPWAARCRQTVKRAIFKFELHTATLLHEQPKKLALSGRLDGSGGLRNSTRGAWIGARESTSGYAAMSNGNGEFL